MQRELDGMSRQYRVMFAVGVCISLAVGFYTILDGITHPDDDPWHLDIVFGAVYILGVSLIIHVAM